ncbi:MAG TPA: hypothetical protein VMD30_08775 [Tepidisphaeraceae bacterium]|nr:hypothetical protein [Tepidisphaeraceae bacterium]
MKTLAILSLLAAMGLTAAFTTGCEVADTPALTAQERWQAIELSSVTDQEELADDTDDALLLRPASHMTMWNVFHRNGLDTFPNKEEDQELLSEPGN